MNTKSMNESEDPESMRDISWVLGMVSDMTGIMRVSRVVMVALRVTVVCAQTGDTQPPGGVGCGRLLNLFLPPRQKTLVTP